MLAAMMTLSLAACGGNESGDDESAKLAAEGITYDVAQHDTKSAEVYEDALGAFAEVYAEAKEADTVSEKFALMAIAEAKLMESGVMVPTNTQGGLYAITRVAPRTVTSTLWGSDVERIHSVVVTTDLIKASDREVMKAEWEKYANNPEVNGYEEWVENYLTEQGYTLKDSYSAAYTGDPETWDVLASSRATTSDVMVQCYDGLFEYNMENEQVPALAESVEISEDGLTYTFKIREGAKWVDAQGTVVADVTADDFVAGMQHMLDAMGGLEYLVQGVIVGANEYINGEITDFAEVGVKAVDDYTLQYTLEAPCTYFLTMLGYSVFAPMNRDYYVSQGGQFGADYDASAEGYTYGTTKDNILYCGPFTVTNFTATNTITFAANESYWNADKMNIKTYTMLYNDGSEASKAYTDAKAGITDGSNLTLANLETCKKEGLFEDYAYVSDTNATSYMVFYNMNRAVFANVADTTAAVSTQTVADAERTNKALNNQNFRLAISFAFDRVAWNGVSTGDEVAAFSLRNTYTPGNFVTLEEEVTVDINGTATTYPAGTYYGEIMQAQIDADGYPIKVWDAESKSSDGYDGWYNPEEAVKYLDAAIAELAEDGVEITAENPIYLDLPYFSGSEMRSQMAQVYKSSVEESLGGKVILNLVSCASADDWYYTGYYTSIGYESNFDLFDLSGWGPDYGDPQTYLDTMLDEYAGYMTKCLGIY